MEPSVAYLAGGRLFVKRPQSDAFEIESPFAAAALERQSREQKVNGWKSHNGVWASAGRPSPEPSQWDMLGGATRRNFSFKSIARGSRANELFYLIDLGGVTGLFRYDLATASESRLMHRNDFPALQLAVAEGHGMAVSLHAGDGSTAVAASDDEGRHWRTLTSGDSVDEAPAWVPGRDRIVYQSAGIARNEIGLPVGQGPYVIESLDVAGTGHVDTLASQAEHDLLLPRVAANGALYFVRRPYQRSPRASASVLTVIRDFLLFPFRLLRMIYDMLNFKSVMYSGRTLTSADPMSLLQRRQGHVMLWGQMVDPRRAGSQPGASPGASLVPQEWELVCRTANGAEQVLARNVLAYDLCSDGSVVYTNGTGIYHTDGAERATSLCSGAMIEAVIAI